MGLEWDLRKAANDPIAPFAINSLNPVKKYFSGIEAELMTLLVDRYGLSLTMIASSDFEYGNYSETNRTFTGKFGLLQNAKVDVVAGSVIFNSERGFVGKYSPRILTSSFVLASKKPKALSEWNAAFRPFPVLGWLILFLSITFVAPISFYITKSHNRLSGEGMRKTESVWTYVTHVRTYYLISKLLCFTSEINLTFQASATLLVEPWPKPPGGPAALIISAWLIACLILQSIYASNFTVQQR